MARESLSPQVKVLQQSGRSFPSSLFVMCSRDTHTSRYLLVWAVGILILKAFLDAARVPGGELNIAAWGTADQSTTYSIAYAQIALDGLSNTCSSTTRQNDPWWKLDLMKTYSVNRVTITNRPDCCESWINGAEIRVGNVSTNVSSNPVCAVVSTIPAGATYSYSCHGMEGRYVTVNIPGTSKGFLLCEVGVYVIFPGNSELLNNLA
uniref:Fucolectin tachylectin-4 pentraxin-1 domain-containing protein n=1 Tax=Cyprinus carpio TaxID=7962 RepID=A0A8C2C0B2_CYPCA